MRIIDANIILRYLTNDVQDQAERAGKLLAKVEAGSEAVFLPDIILADIIWVLEGYYKQSREQIREWITTILSMRGLRFSDKNVALDADVYKRQLLSSPVNLYYSPFRQLNPTQV